MTDSPELGLEGSVAYAEFATASSLKPSTMLPGTEESINPFAASAPSTLRSASPAAISSESRLAVAAWCATDSALMLLLLLSRLLPFPLELALAGLRVIATRLQLHRPTNWATVALSPAFVP